MQETDAWIMDTFFFFFTWSAKQLYYAVTRVQNGILPDAHLLSVILTGDCDPAQS